METLAINPQSSVEPMTVVTVSIEQGTHNINKAIYLPAMPNIQELANVVLNEAYSQMTMKRMAISNSKNRPSLNKPFVFSVAIECGEKSMIIPDFEAKISFTDEGIQKILENMPVFIAEMVLPVTMPFLERRKAISQAQNLQLVLS